MPPWATGVPALSPRSSAAAASSRAVPLPSGTICSGHLPGSSSSPTACNSASGPAAVGPGVVPLHGDVVQRECPLAGQPVHHPVGALDDPAGPGIGPGLVVLEPERLGKHPLGRDPTGDIAENRVARLADGLGLAVRPLIHPEQGGTERLSLQVARHAPCRRCNRARSPRPARARRRSSASALPTAVRAAIHHDAGSCSAHVGRGYVVSMGATPNAAVRP